uniref:Uncharacterized protein n=1 Tax=Mycena chlorophos TaxID=658473 RepID=A0ABQ0MA83_MYCCL|nr:predicted protein [Mycena chlorophos]
MMLNHIVLENEDDVRSSLADPKLRTLVNDADAEYGYKQNTWIFGATPIPKIAAQDLRSAATVKVVPACVCVCELPAGFAVDDFERYVDKYLSLPVLQGKCTEYTMWIANDDALDHSTISGFGEPGRGEFWCLERTVIEWTKGFQEEAGQRNGSFFGAERVTVLEREA